MTILYKYSRAHIKRTYPYNPKGLIAGVVLALLAGVPHSTWAQSLTLPDVVINELQKASIPEEALSLWVQEAGLASVPPRVQWQADVNRNPASLMKILTTAAALDTLGPAWSWRTPVWVQGSIEPGGAQGGSRLRGSVVIQGSGDPTWVSERVWLMWRRVQQLGIQHIQGDIVLDRSAFSIGARDPAEFDGDPTRSYNAQPDALMLNYKSVSLTFIPDRAAGVARVTSEPPLADFSVAKTLPLSAQPCESWRALISPQWESGGVTWSGAFPAACGERYWQRAFHDPQEFNAQVLRGVWQSLGGTLSGRVVEGQSPASAPTFEVVSPPLAQVVRDINKFSNNVMAQHLFLALGQQRAGIASEEASREAMVGWLKSKLGEETVRSVVIDNGSGLSRQTRVSAKVLAQTLQLAWSSRWMPELMASLPVSGVDGTLVNFKSHHGMAHLKTGSLSGVAGMAGYVLSRSGRRFVVVVMVNHPRAALARPAIDALISTVGEL
jgi:serine-type D-Ala-D-Ala carboxypeptidase/endopeptidase (penicillin-binding protein 4)